MKRLLPDVWYQRRDAEMAVLTTRGPEKEALRQVIAAFPEASGYSVPYRNGVDVHVSMVSLSPGVNGRRLIVGVNGHGPVILYDTNDDSELPIPHRPHLVQTDNGMELRYELPGRDGAVERSLPVKR